jgi:hypothetical protein
VNASGRLARFTRHTTDFGGQLDWGRQDEKRASRIRKVIDMGGYRDQERWPEIQDEQNFQKNRLLD